VQSAVKISCEIAGANVFTGIIEEMGRIQELRFLSQGAIITVGAGLVAADLKIGDSISVNGVCLTATRIGAGFFVCDISAETLRISSFKHAKQGSCVNLERSLRVGDRLGGHFVQGHVDGIGRLISKTASGEGFEMSFDFPRELERYMVYKGSLAVNGISLTISSLSKGIFSVAVIPHTFESTNLNQLIISDLVNLEVDILGKYFERFFQLGLRQTERNTSRITSEYLKDQGF
jgi:riboflavin synthase